MTIEKNQIDAALKLLDIQRKYCVDSGVFIRPGCVYINSKTGDQKQISYYDGHVNLMESLLLPDYVLCVDHTGKHYIKEMEL